jgi:hypothetical protein
MVVDGSSNGNGEGQVFGCMIVSDLVLLTLFFVVPE